ncbi:MAG: tRNA pseudouridine(38-40) synthase TruA [Gammaproteobacteria bacterium]|nr:tRNA pseudouridine(38-40) synthase TruA [Gammaproteobacteria bacterium]
MRIALGIEYDGSGFSGWQVQSHARTVQGCVEQAASVVANHPVRIACAGRTDTGVHATGQVVHFDTDADRSDRAWLMGINANLPADVGVTWAQPVSDDFHARYAAERRTYRYVILNRPARPGLFAAHVGFEYRPLELERMVRAARYLLGEHDFSAFRGAGCQSKTPWREVQNLSVEGIDGFINVEITANAFLLHMVRNIVGTLLVAGTGTRPPEWVGEVLASRDRTRAGMTAPPGGLYLVRVEYPSRFGLPAAGPRRSLRFS